MLFFLKYAKSEDLSLTHQEFKKQVGFCWSPNTFRNLCFKPSCWSWFWAIELQVLGRTRQSNVLHPSVSSYLDWAEGPESHHWWVVFKPKKMSNAKAQQQYRPGRELVDLSRSHSLMDSTDVSAARCPSCSLDNHAKGTRLGASKIYESEDVKTLWSCLFVRHPEPFNEAIRVRADVKLEYCGICKTSSSGFECHATHFRFSIWFQASVMFLFCNRLV